MGSTTAPLSSASSLNSTPSIDAELLGLVQGLSDLDGRFDAARRLARHLGAEELIIFVPDPELNVLLPGLGFPQTLPETSTWHAFLSRCLHERRATAEVAFPAAVYRSAVGFASYDGTVLVLLGGTPDLERGRNVCQLLPLLGLAFRNERVAQIATTQAAVARAAATEIRALADELAAAKQELQRSLYETDRALRARDEFLSVAAHELRTPITSLRGYAQLLLRRLRRNGETDAATVHQTMGVIEQQTEKLSFLVTQLLDITRLQAGRLVLQRTRTNVRALVMEAVEGIRAKLTAHDIVVDAPDEVYAEIDPIRIEQVLINLLDNAVKYSPDGGKVHVEVSQPSPDEVTIAVRDHGIGIPPEHRGKIFDRYYQAAADSPSGLGLGLYISRQIIDLHRGQIGAEFPQDGGTRFIVMLPVSPGEHALS